MNHNYTTKDIISVLTMSLIIANGNKDNMLHALEVAEQEIEKMLEKERKDAYEHNQIIQEENFNTIIQFLAIDGFDDASKKVWKFAKDANIID